MDSALIPIPIRSEEDCTRAIERASQLLARVESPADAKQVADLAAAAEKYGKLRRADKEAIARAMALRVDAMTRLGELLCAMDLSAGRPSKRNGSVLNHFPQKPTLRELGVSKRESADSQALAQVKELNPDLHRSIRETGRVKDAHEWLKEREEGHGPDASGGDVEDTPAETPEGSGRIEVLQEKLGAVIRHLCAARNMLDEITHSPDGILLREFKVLESEGRLFEKFIVDRMRGKTKIRGERYRCAGLEKLIIACRRACPKKSCSACQGKGCSACRNTGYVPSDPKLIAPTTRQTTLEFTGDSWEEATVE